MTSSIKKHLWQLSTRLKMFKKHQLPAIRRFQAVLRETKRPMPPGKITRRNLLVLAWEFPPQVTGGVYRPASFVKHTTDNGWHTHIVASALPAHVSEAGQYLASSIPSSVVVHRLASAPSGPHVWPLPDIDGGILNALSVYERASQLIHSMEPGIILASGPPFHNFVAGMWLAKRFGWKLIIDYRDEWSECPFDFVKKDVINRQWETQCQQIASRVIFTTQSQIEHQLSHFSRLSRDKCTLITNGWRPEDFSITADTSPVKNRDKLSIAYLGNLGPMASPTEFFEVLAQVLSRNADLRDRLSIKLIGKKRDSVLEEIAQHPYRDNFELIEQIPKPDACRMMTEMDGLLLLNPPGIARYIQGKLYEYIASGTPILAFGEDGEMGRIIEDLRCGTCIRSDSADELEAALISLDQPHTNDVNKIEAWLQSRQRDVIAQDMLKLLETVQSE